MTKAFNKTEMLWKTRCRGFASDDVPFAGERNDPAIDVNGMSPFSASKGYFKNGFTYISSVTFHALLSSNAAGEIRLCPVYNGGSRLVQASNYLRIVLEYCLLGRKCHRLYAVNEVYSPKTCETRETVGK